MKNFSIMLVLLFLANGATAQWVPQNSGTTGDLKSVCFPDANTGYACGDSGIVKTTDGGETWNKLDAGNYWSFASVCFIDADTGYAAGRGDPPGTACILKTTDGGMNWSLVFNYNWSSGSYLTSLCFPNPMIGYAVGYSITTSMGEHPFIASTKNGGYNWTVTTSFPGASGGIWSGVHFISPDTGYVVGRSSITGLTSGRILKTTNGGVEWTLTLFSIPWTMVNLKTVHFPCRDTGYAAGSILVKTTDGGITWANLDNASGSSMFFTDASTGYLAGESGSILKTTDGAASWTTLSGGTSLALRSVFFTNNDTGYVAGNGGLILKTTNGGGFAVGTEEITNYGLRITNFPNPVYQTTTFSYFLKNDGPVSIQIFNSSGSLVAEPAEAYQNRGEQKMTWNPGALPAGVYLYRLRTGNELTVGKLIRIP